MILHTCIYINIHRYIVNNIIPSIFANMLAAGKVGSPTHLESVHTRLLSLEVILNLVHNDLQLVRGQVALLKDLDGTLQTVHTPRSVLDCSFCVPVQGLAVLFALMPVTLVVTFVRPEILAVTLF